MNIECQYPNGSNFIIKLENTILENNTNLFLVGELETASPFTDILTVVIPIFEKEEKLYWSDLIYIENYADYRHIIYSAINDEVYESEEYGTLIKKTNNISPRLNYLLSEDSLEYAKYMGEFFASSGRGTHMLSNGSGWTPTQLQKPTI